MVLALFGNHRCFRCQQYQLRIKELEEINDLHRRLNGELRETINLGLSSLDATDMLGGSNECNG
tara:strand:- start:213 stop:404 length:192 start_codon:yes stop_codon:yes gene_type:complete